MTNEMERAMREQSERFREALNAQTDEFVKAINAQTEEFVKALNAQTDEFAKAINAQSDVLRAQMRSNRRWTVGTMIAFGLAIAGLIIGMGG